LDHEQGDGCQLKFSNYFRFGDNPTGTRTDGPELGERIALFSTVENASATLTRKSRTAPRFS
jgi:hypothetical protein